MKTVRLLFMFVALTSSLCAQWTQMTAPSGSGINYSQLLSTDSAFLAGSNGLGIHKSTDNGLTWTKIANATIEASTNVLTPIGKKIYIGTYSTGVHVTADYGKTWAAKATGMVSKNITSIASMGRYLYAAGTTFYRSVDSGATWTVAGTGLPAKEVKGIIVTGGKIILSAKTAGIYTSTDSGATFTASNGNLPYTYTLDLIQKGSKLFLVLGSTVVASTDNGTTWTDAGTGLSSPNILSIFTDGTNMFLGTFGSGCMFTGNDGSSWNAANTGLTPANTRSYAVRGNYVFCGADAGIWRRPLSEFATSVEDGVTNGPASFALAQNYPNPFNPSTTIRFSLPVRAHVRLVVYNALGQTVQVLMNEERERGQYDAIFDASRCASGIYFYSIVTGSFNEMKKMLLLR